jgi:aerobic carbon-monoxide dehydrogenase medium subunit
MKPATFEYASPEYVEDVIGLLVGRGPEAKVLAGGQSLVPLMALRLATPDLIVDLNRVRELEYVRLEGGTLVIGALARQRDVERLPLLRQRCPMLAEAAEVVGHVAVRNRGTVVGSLAHADPAAEWPAVSLALDAECDVRGPNGIRTIPVSELLQTSFTTALEAEEVMQEVRITLPKGDQVGSTFVEMAPWRGGFAIVGVGALLRLDDDGTVSDARIALNGACDTAVRAKATETALVGRAPTAEAIAEATEALEEEIDPVNDMHGSSDYRRHIAKLLTHRALGVARDRAERGSRGPS